MTRRLHSVIPYSSDTPQLWDNFLPVNLTHEDAISNRGTNACDNSMQQCIIDTGL